MPWFVINSATATRFFNPLNNSADSAQRRPAFPLTRLTVELDNRRSPFGLGAGNGAMGFGQAIASAFKNYFNFHGRASRSEFWWFVLFAVVTNVLCEVLDVMIGENATFGPFYILAQLIFFFPMFSLEVRRLHDTSKSGWNVLWALTIIGLVPLIVFWAEPGQRMANAHGADPLGAHGDAAAPMQPTAATPAGVDLAALEKMGELHKAGVLTDEEFAEQKAKLLNSA